MRRKQFTIPDGKFVAIHQGETVTKDETGMRLGRSYYLYEYGQDTAFAVLTIYEPITAAEVRKI